MKVLKLHSTLGKSSVSAAASSIGELYLVSVCRARRISLFVMSLSSSV